MDFSFTSDQEELRRLANRVLTDRCTPEHLKDVAFGDGSTGVDLELWSELAEPRPRRHRAARVRRWRRHGLRRGGHRARGGRPHRRTDPGPAGDGDGRSAASPSTPPTSSPAWRRASASSPSPSTSWWAPVSTPGARSRRAARSPASRPTSRSARSPTPSSSSAVDGVYLVEADAAGVTVERQDAVDDIPDALVTFDGAAGVRIAGPEAPRSPDRRTARPGSR